MGSCRPDDFVLWREPLSIATIRMKKTAPPTLGLAANNAGGNRAQSLHVADIGRVITELQAKTKVGDPTGPPYRFGGECTGSRLPSPTLYTRADKTQGVHRNVIRHLRRELFD
jgi:hypothetical protein